MCEELNENRWVSTAATLATHHPPPAAQYPCLCGSHGHSTGCYALAYCPAHPAKPHVTASLALFLSRSFEGIDLALFSAGGSISKKFGPIASAAGATVVDNSSAFRMTEGVPLIIPEVNAEVGAGWKGGCWVESRGG